VGTHSSNFSLHGHYEAPPVVFMRSSSISMSSFDALYLFFGCQHNDFSPQVEEQCDVVRCHVLRTKWLLV